MPHNLLCKWRDCSYATSNDSNLLFHCRKHVEEYTPSEINCKCQWSTCQFNCSRYHGLKSHLITHIPVKIFACDICHRHFSRRYDMKKHIKAIHIKSFDMRLVDINVLIRSVN